MFYRSYRDNEKNIDNANEELIEKPTRDKCSGMRHSIYDKVGVLFENAGFVAFKWCNLASNKITKENYLIVLDNL